MGQAIWPTDPASGGTWIGLHECGFTAVLLNRNPWRSTSWKPVTPAPSSRGTIIPWLMAATNLAGALDRVAKLHGPDFAPFRLLLVDVQGIVEIRWNGGLFRQRQWPLDRPRCFTSSGLGDFRVQRLRLQLFRQLVSGERASLPERQDAYHQHRWSRYPELSVCMERIDARTVSQTWVVRDDASMNVAYRPLEAHATTLGGGTSWQWLGPIQVGS